MLFRSDDEHRQREGDHAQRRFPVPGDPGLRFPFERRAHRLLIPCHRRFRRREIEQRRQLRPVPDMRQNERCPAKILRAHHHCRRAQDTIDPRLVMLSVGNVLDGELVPLVSTEADQPKIREYIPIPRRQQPAPAPQQTLLRERNFHRQLSGKIHLRHLLRLGRRFEERILLEAKYLRRDIARKLPA